MHPDIASLHERMSKGGEWRAFRDEIATLHPLAKSQDEYITLLEAHQTLRHLIPEVYDAETSAKLQKIASGEYLMFLNVEAMEGGQRINPLLLDMITAREVEAGRMAADDEFREFARAGGAVFGDTAPMDVPHRRYGDWLFYGVAVAALILALTSIIQWPVAVGIVAAGLIVGFVINDGEARRIKREVTEKRQASPNRYHKSGNT